MLLENLQGALAGMATDWDMTFLGGGAEGLAALAQAPFDVVVSDLWMPGMNGAEFLREVQARHPGAIRFILSSSTDREMAMSLVERAHQFLAKPCNPAFLRTVILRTLELGREVDSAAVREMVARIGQLPVLPSLYLEINGLLESDRATLENLGRIISQDVAMTAMILKLANSAFFHPRHPISSALEAIPHLGIDLLQSLVLAHGLFSQAGPFGIPGFTLDDLWDHSLRVAETARRVAHAEQVGNRREVECFNAGILHDVGILVLASGRPDAYRRVLEDYREAGSDLESTECHVFGASHGDVGGYLLGLWGLPAPIVQAAARHSCPTRLGPEGFSPTLAVHVANGLRAMDPGAHPLFARESVDAAYLDAAGLKHRLPVWREMN